MGILISEGREAPGVLSAYAGARGIGEGDARLAFEQLGERIRARLRLSSSPLSLTSTGLVTKGFAGSVGLDGGFEIEVAPKYAHADNPHWRQDLLFMSMLSKHGDLLLQNQIYGTQSTANDLASLVAEVLLRLFYGNRRTPLKVHRYVDFHSFALEGDIEPEDLLLPDSEGFKQRRFQFDSDNEFSSTVRAAAVQLSHVVRDPSLLARLRRLVADIGPVSRKPSTLRRVLPTRLRRWQTLYDLSFDVTRDKSLSPGQGLHRLPGFVISTWQTWQDFVGRALVLGFGASSVLLQQNYPLGVSHRKGVTTSVRTTPDCVLTGFSPQLIVDAKYKGRADDDLARISDGDFYETLGFMRGVPTSRAVLIYPSTGGKTYQTGRTEILEDIRLSNGDRMWAVSLDVNGISRPSGLLAFTEGLKQCVHDIAVLGT